MIYLFLIFIIFCQWWGHRTQRREVVKLRDLKKTQSAQISELQGLLGHCRDQKEQNNEPRSSLRILKDHNEWLINHYERKIADLTRQVHMYEREFRERDREHS